MDNCMLSTGKDDWETPDQFFDELNKEFNFTLDPCATNKNNKCKKFFTLEDDGLKMDWGNEIVFCNPPYSKKEKGRPGQESWIRKCYEEGKKTTVVMLILLVSACFLSFLQEENNSCYVNSSTHRYKSLP